MASSETEEDGQGSMNDSHDPEPAPKATTSAESRFPFSQTRPVLLALALLPVVLALQVVDVFVLQLIDFPELLIASRVLGILVLLGYLWLLRRPISAIGLHRENATWAFVIGGLSFIALLVVGYGVQMYQLETSSYSPQLVFGAMDPATGSSAGVTFTAIIVGGIVLNSFLEEGLFRGVLLTHFMRRLSF